MGNLPNLGIVLSQLKYVLLAGGDENQLERLAYQTIRVAVSDYIQRYIVEYPEDS